MKTDNRVFTRLLHGASATAVLAGMLMLSPMAQASTALTADDAAAEAADDATGDNSAGDSASDEGGSNAIIVSGSRIVRDGYQAPTPTTVLGADEIRRAAPLNLSDTINQLPALAGSTRMNTSTISAGLVGVNALNLRNLGTQRTLVLLDGQRMPASTTGGLVDVSTIPDSLVERVEVVTGGASAAWGSDAVAGVVNYVLNTSFTGLKGEVSGGITTYGDDPNYRLSLAAGTHFADGRGHIMANIEQTWNEGIHGIPRDWYVGAKQMFNPAYTPANGQPEMLAATNVGYTTVAPGGIITSGPLRGIYFGPGGAPAQLNFGSVVRDPYMIGGDWQVTDFGNGPQALNNPMVRQNAFVRASFEVARALEVYGQFGWSRAKTDMITTPMFQFGGLTITRENPFLPESIGARMDELGLTTLDVGTWNQDIGGLPYKADRNLYRYVIGTKGEFDMLGSDWQWDAYWNRNVSDFKQELYIPINANYRRAIDTVMGPNGVPICRSTLTDPNNGCVPLNILGTGVASTGALNYVNGTAWLDATITQDTYAATLQGEPFATWAGPVSLAAGIEHRREASKGNSDELSKVNSYWAGNFKAIVGSYTVTEGFVEVALPLAAELPFAHALDVNAAIRGTDYSSSGFVTTWKLGATWAPVPDIRFRITRSRDIRAGNLADLFQPGQTLTSTFSDPFVNNESYAMFYTAVGNPVINPEKADTFNVGAVFEPRFIPGFSASVDYWDISVKDAIASISVGTLLNECFAGDQSLCQFIERGADGRVSNITLRPVNLASQVVRGIDYEASYRTDLAMLGLPDSQLTLRALATNYLENSSLTGLVGANPTSSLGTFAGTPEWRYLLQASLTAGKLTTSLTGRGMSDGVLSNTYVECRANCPTSSATARTIDNNHVDGFFYIDLSASYRFRPEVEAFFSVSNLANKAPAVIPNPTGIGSQQWGVNQLYYDVIGRSFRAGFRFNF
ncbi:TonB-dependent receptor [Altererythrobacter xixiisoli]|uniref:TonB-dependent receptor n=1 Tax=Croceibacterium xixiisoli TaxID=1476466 RepID=A0A6I4TXQ3_9SPHN|nr:TonB-dependent receptor [Croceibacterium xixiisoli]MXO99547.1 TonB-dependent receptor [Croceibacterium xixiisoli]